MDNISIKYKILNQKDRRKLNAFLDYLLSKQDSVQQTSTAEYKKRILKIPVWSEDDLRGFKINQEAFNNWKVEEW